MLLEDYCPQPMLVRRVTEIVKPAFPVIDAHNHLTEGFGGYWDQRPVQDLLHVLDEAGVSVLVDLDGMWSEDTLDKHLKQFKEAYPDRFSIIGGVDFSKWDEHGDRFGEWAANRVRKQVERGAAGIKVWKNLGLRVRDQHGNVISVDDERLDPIWAAAGEMSVPVILHVADPVAFFEPLDHTNERWEELHAHPEWQFPSPPFSSFISLVEGMARVVERHSKTTFIGAHVGCYAENLAWVAELLDRCPNFFIDISGRLGELGRQPYTARRFLIQYSDRVLFGVDMAANVEAYRLHYRFLETDDEYMNYGISDPPKQGRWMVHGLHLPGDVLARIYHENAEKVLLGR